MIPILSPDRSTKMAIDRFLGFYAVLTDIKTEASKVAVPGGDLPDGVAAPDAGPSVADIFIRLQTAIREAAIPAAGGAAGPDIGYVMAALADEILLHEVEWSGRDQWLGLLLEASLYGSRACGEEIFALADSILDGVVVGRSDLAAVILLALSLGFRGRWRGVDDKGEVDDLRRRLFEYIYRFPPPTRFEWTPVMPAALQPVLPGGDLLRLPRIGLWAAAIVLSVVVTVTLSQLIWNKANTALLDQAARIVQFAESR